MICFSDRCELPDLGLTFHVVETTSGATAVTGEITLRVADDPQSSEDVYADVYRATTRVSYRKRDTTLTAPYADPGFERSGIGDLLDAVFHPVLGDYPLTRGEQPFAFKAISKGWYDAGDYGQYTHNAASVWPTIVLALALAPACLLTDGELGIPESGNGIPDIVDELRWGIQCALSMQDDDGSVYWWIGSGCWDTGMPADVSEARFVYEKTTRSHRSTWPPSAPSSARP